MIRTFSDHFSFDIETVFKHLVLLEEAEAWISGHLQIDNKIYYENDRPVRYETNIYINDKWAKAVYDITKYEYIKEVRIIERSIKYLDGVDVNEEADFPYRYSGQRITLEESNDGSLVKYEVYLRPKGILDILTCYHDYFNCIKENTLEMNANLKNYLSHRA